MEDSHGEACPRGDAAVLIPIADKGDLLSIGRPARFGVPTRAVRQIGLVRAVGVHDEHLPIPGPRRGEGDLFAVGSAAGVRFVVSRLGECRLVGAVGIDAVELRFAAAP
jgi:hypothetical protein